MVQLYSEHLGVLFRCNVEQCRSDKKRRKVIFYTGSRPCRMLASFPRELRVQERPL